MDRTLVAGSRLRFLFCSFSMFVGWAGFGEVATRAKCSVHSRILWLGLSEPSQPFIEVDIHAFDSELAVP